MCQFREAPVRFGSVAVRGWNGSSGSGFRFRRFLCKNRGFSVFQYSLTGQDGSGFGSWKTVPAVLLPLSVSGKTVPTVPVPGSSSVPEPPCNSQRIFLVSPTEKERRRAFVRVQIEYGSGCFQVRFRLVVSTVWIGSEYGFVILLDESASESHTRNSTRTSP